MMMLPSTYSAPVPARETEPETAAEPTPRPEPAPWVRPRVLLLVGMAVLALAYVQRETRDAAVQPKPEQVRTEPPKPAEQPEPAPTIERASNATVRKATVGCLSSEDTVRVIYKLPQPPEFECIKLKVGARVTIIQDRPGMARVRLGHDVHWLATAYWVETYDLTVANQEQLDAACAPIFKRGLSKSPKDDVAKCANYSSVRDGKL